MSYRMRTLHAQARLRVGVRLQHLQSERSTLVAKLQALSDPQDVEMYEQVGRQTYRQAPTAQLCGQPDSVMFP